MSVAWVAVGAAAVGTVYSANKASKANSNATAAAKDVAQQEIELSREALNFYKTQHADQKSLQDRAASTAFQVANSQIESQRKNDAIAQDYWDYQKGTFRPLEQGIVADAQTYDTAERREAKAAGAVADVGMQAEMARQAQTRDMQRMGVNPASGKMLAMQTQMGLSEAAAKAGAANTAREAVELQGYARKMDAANLGRNLASNQATSAGLAITAGDSAARSAGMPLTQAQQSTQTMGQGYSTALQGMGNAGNTFSSIAKTGGGGGSDIWGGLGDLAGQFAGSQAGSQLIASWLPTSDKNAKKKVRGMSDEQALEAIEKTPVSQWTYKDGEGDGGRHTGPMAQDVNKNMGEGAAPGGKKLDLITMNGVTMAGMAALSRKVDKLTKKIEGAAA